MARPAPHARGDYPHAREITTRWMDNDAYGHVNNVVYYSYFDTVVNDWLIRQGLLDVEKGAVIGLVVETGCQYFESLTYPETVTAALRVAHVGTSSVRYEIALFGEGKALAAAQGHFVHVYVDRGTRRPASLPEHWRRALATLAPVTP
ncbi:MAG: acyl-CoA thioesterase [Betaproteobacteria bacterium]|nr:acyl-CoA thioesterase [Betaproteobacteria bacterium]